MAGFLESLPDDVQLDWLMLTNEKATKTAVAAAFRQHLGC